MDTIKLDMATWDLVLNASGYIAIAQDAAHRNLALPQIEV